MRCEKIKQQSLDHNIEVSGEVKSNNEDLMSIAKKILDVVKVDASIKEVYRINGAQSTDSG